MMNKHKGSVISGRIGRPARGKRSSSSSSIIFSSHPSPSPSQPSSRQPPLAFAPSHLCPPSSSVSISSSLSRRAVMKMLAVMESSSRDANGGGGGEGDDIAQDFLTSGRTGRRNALPDILGETATITLSSASPLGAAAADLPSRLQKLSCTDSSKEEESSEGESNPSEEQCSRGKTESKRPEGEDEKSGSKKTIPELETYGSNKIKLTPKRKLRVMLNKFKPDKAMKSVVSSIMNLCTCVIRAYFYRWRKFCNTSDKNDVDINKDV